MGNEVLRKPCLHYHNVNGQFTSLRDSTLCQLHIPNSITNATVYVDRGIIVIAVIVQSNNQPGSGFIASVSYNGVKLATTGDTGSRWKVLEGMIYDGAWYDPTYDDSSWASADESALCGVDTAPSTNPDGLSYSSVISNNGMTPGQQTAQYGGDLARWVGISGPESYCSESMSAMYRLVLNLTDLVEEPACYTENDGRSVLGPQTPIMHVPSIGAKSTTSREVSFVGGADGFLDVWMNGIGILRPRCRSMWI